MLNFTTNILLKIWGTFVFLQNMLSIRVIFIRAH